MKIYIRADKMALCIPVPNRLLCNATAIRILNRSAGISIPPKMGKALYREIHRLKRQNPEWNLVEIEGTDGETVRIRL